MSVQHHRDSVRRHTHVGKPVLNVVVVLRPAIDVRAVTTGPPEAALVITVNCDACARELRCDARIAARVFRETVHEEDMRASTAHRRWPPIRAQIETVSCTNEVDGTSGRLARHQRQCAPISPEQGDVGRPAPRSSCYSSVSTTFPVFCPVSTYLVAWTTSSNG